MAKITVTAKKDFFDRHNNIQRKKGDSFILKAEAAKTFAGVDYINLDAEGKKAVEKVNETRIAAAAPAKKEVTEGKDMSMANNISSAPAKATAPTKSAPAKAPAKKTAAPKKAAKK